MSEIIPIDEPMEIQQVSHSALSEITRSEVDIQVQTAKKYPRSIRKFQQEALSMATLTPEVAESCFYSLPRGGKPIEGPSARLAEIVASAWGNMRIAARTVGDDGKSIKCQAVCHDLERNVAAAIEVSRKITGRDGRRFSDDMVNVTANAGTSIAYRNAIFKIIPKAYWWPIYLEARRVAVGDVKTLEAKRSDMIAYFGKMGITPDRVLSSLGVQGLEDITLEHLATMKGIATALKDGDATVEEVFPIAPKPDTNGSKKSKTAAIADQVAPEPKPEGVTDGEPK